MAFKFIVALCLIGAVFATWNCWNECGQTPGYCKACKSEDSIASKPCCRIGWNDGNGCNGKNGCHGYHCCASDTKDDCWNYCGGKGGECPNCKGGLGQSCCRKGWDDGKACCNGNSGCNGYHCCVPTGQCLPAK